MESFFLIAAECLGVKVFKRYWICGGSYWNNRHISSNNANDLRWVANFSYYHSINHCMMLLAESLISIWQSKLNIMPIVLFMLPFHSYALMVQLYNNILAKRALRNLKIEY